MKKTLSRAVLAMLALALVLTSVSFAAAEVEAPVQFPYTGEPVVFSGYAYTGLNQDPALPCIQAWKDHIGNLSIEYDFASYSDYQEKSKILLATGDLPDVLPIANIMGVISQYGDSGILLDFNKYLDYMPNLKKYIETYPNLNWICNADGARYGIIGVQPIDHAGEGWFANMDVLKAAGVEAMPTNFPELLAALRKVKEYDPTSIPFMTYWNIPYTQKWMARCIGAQTESLVYFDTAAGEYKATYREASAKRKELIETMRMLYAEKLINPEIATMANEQETAFIGTGKWAITAMYNASLEKEIFKVLPGEDLPYDIQPMTPPADENGVRRLPLAYQHDGLPTWGIVCSAKTEHPELLAAYMDQVVSEFGRNLFNYGIEGETYDVIDGVPTLREDADTAKYGVGTQYEVWMVGMGPVARISPYKLGKAIIDLDIKNFKDGTVIADIAPAYAIFGSEAAAEKADIENTLKTYIEENEAQFIYGLRDMSEWDAYVAEMENYASLDDLLALYNTQAQIIVREPARIYTTN